MGINEQVLRFLGRRQPLDYESIALPVFWFLIPVWLFPWSVFVPAAGQVFHGARDSAPRRAVLLVSGCWALLVLAFFSVSSRIEHYSLPLIPPLALLFGFALSPDPLPDPRAELRRRRWVNRGFAMLCCVGFFAAAILLVLTVFWAAGAGVPSGSSGNNLAGHMQAYKFYFAPVFDLPPETRRGLFFPFVGTLVALASGLTGAWWAERRRRRWHAVGLLCATMGAFCLFTFRSIGVCEEMLSSRQFGQTLAQLWKPDDVFVVVGDFETANSINFYSPAPVHVYGGGAALLEWGLRYPDAPKRIVNSGEFSALWSDGRRAFVLCPDGFLPDLRLAPAHVLQHSAGRTLLCNRPTDGLTMDD